MTTPALRHLIYRELLLKLSHPSRDQVEQLCVNLGWIYRPFNKKRQKELILDLSLKMRVAPELDETFQPFSFTIQRFAIDYEMRAAFGDSLEGVAGFYLQKGKWRVNLPKSVFLLPYFSTENPRLICGMICVVPDALRRYFLLSSAKLSFGSAAVPLDFNTKSLLENFNGKCYRQTADSSRNAA
ncbi:MAG TPA: hypothetical protein VF596_11830 [Pyrinomonadaceae bacterium]|jgi:hypothetical protein